MLSAVDRYMARLIRVPLLSWLFIAAMLLVLDRMRRLFDFVATEGGPCERRVAHAGQSAARISRPRHPDRPHARASCLPSASSRCPPSSTFCAAWGLSYTSLLKVPYLYAIVLAILNLGIVGYIQPHSRYAYERLSFELRSGALGASIKIGEFVNLPNDSTIRIEKSEDEARKLSGMFVRMQEKSGQTFTATAAHGQFLATDDPDTIILRLSDGVLVHDSPSFQQPRILSFSSHDLPIDLPKMEAFRGRGDGDIELSLIELFRSGISAHSTPLQRARAWSNFNYRIVEVAMMFLLPLAAVRLRHSAQALHIGARRVPLDRVHRDLSQDQTNMRSPWARSARSIPSSPLWGSVPAGGGAHRLDVLPDRLCAGRPADRRAGTAILAGRRPRSWTSSSGSTGRAGQRSQRQRDRPRCSRASSRSRALASYVGRTFLWRCVAMLAIAGAGAADARPLERGGVRPCLSRQWRRRALALCKPAGPADRLPLPPLLGAARHANHAGDAQCQ